MFCLIKKKEFEAFLFALSKDTYRVLDSNSMEYVYGVPLKKHKDLTIRIYSSISLNSQVAREKGIDAIRIVLWDLNKKKAIGGQVHTKRTDGWMDRIKQKMIGLGNSVGDLTCENCGGYLVVKKNKRNGNKFLGCTNYNGGCKFTQPLNRYQKLKK